MKFKVLLDFDCDMPEDDIEEFTDAARQCLEEGAEAFYASVVVLEIEAIVEGAGNETQH